jgi:hypothetical protein
MYAFERREADGSKRIARALVIETQNDSFLVVTDGCTPAHPQVLARHAK